MKKFIIPTIILLLTAVSIMVVSANDNAQLLGPTSYLCFDSEDWPGTDCTDDTDSPFKDIAFSYFHFEDFEDMNLDAPGVSATAVCVGRPPELGCPFIASLHFSKISTDSVDEDDGSIDGYGRTIDGHAQSFWADGNPGITFSFDEGILGTLPTHVGIAWTDGAGQTTFEAFNSEGVSLGTIGPVSIANGGYDGTTDDDHFFGVVYAGGVSAININNSLGIEVDHLQYGYLPSVISVAIDIKPGSYPNCFNNNGHGVIPVAILSDANFDSTQVDPTTVSLNGLAIRIVGKGNTQAHIEDINYDGLEDMVVQIEDVDGTYEEGDVIATLTGQTFSGTTFEGSDSICIVP